MSISRESDENLSGIRNQPILSRQLELIDDAIGSVHPVQLLDVLEDILLDKNHREALSKNDSLQEKFTLLYEDLINDIAENRLMGDTNILLEMKLPDIENLQKISNEMKKCEDELKQLGDVDKTNDKKLQLEAIMKLLTKSFTTQIKISFSALENYGNSYYEFMLDDFIRSNSYDKLLIKIERWIKIMTLSLNNRDFHSALMIPGAITTIAEAVCGGTELPLLSDAARKQYMRGNDMLMNMKPPHRLNLMIGNSIPFSPNIQSVIEFACQGTLSHEILVQVFKMLSELQKQKSEQSSATTSFQDISFEGKNSADYAWAFLQTKKIKNNPKSLFNYYMKSIATSKDHKSLHDTSKYSQFMRFLIQTNSSIALKEIIPYFMKKIPSDPLKIEVLIDIATDMYSIHHDDSLLNELAKHHQKLDSSNESSVKIGMFIAYLLLTIKNNDEFIQQIVNLILKDRMDINLIVFNALRNTPLALRDKLQQLLTNYISKDDTNQLISQIAQLHPLKIPPKDYSDVLSPIFKQKFPAKTLNNFNFNEASTFLHNAEQKFSTLKENAEISYEYCCRNLANLNVKFKLSTNPELITLGNEIAGIFDDMKWFASISDKIRYIDGILKDHHRPNKSVILMDNDLVSALKDLKSSLEARQRVEDKTDTVEVKLRFTEEEKSKIGIFHEKGRATVKENIDRRHQEQEHKVELRRQEEEKRQAEQRRQEEERRQQEEKRQAEQRRQEDERRQEKERQAALKRQEENRKAEQRRLIEANKLKKHGTKTETRRDLQTFFDKSFDDESKKRIEVDPKRNSWAHERLTESPPSSPSSPLFLNKSAKSKRSSLGPETTKTKQGTKKKNIK